MNTSNGRSDASCDVEKLVDRMLDAWPNHKMDPAQLAMHVHRVGNLVAECGLSRVEASLEAAFTRCRFLPSGADLRDLLPSPEQFAQHRDPECRECLGSGWKTVNVPADPRHRELYPAENTMRRSQHCHCEPPPATRKNESLEVEHVG